MGNNPAQPCMGRIPTYAQAQLGKTAGPICSVEDSPWSDVNTNKDINPSHAYTLYTKIQLEHQLLGSHHL